MLGPFARGQPDEVASCVRSCLIGIVFMSTLASGACARSVPPSAASQSDGEPSVLPKAVIYATAASLFDIAVGYFVGGGLTTGTATALVNATSGWLLYYVHEDIWATEVPLDPPPRDLAVAKTATFTLANSLRLLGLGVVVAQNPAVSAGFLALNAVSDVAAYVVTDRIWTLLSARKIAAAVTP